ncbi:hypothetical protein DVH05_005351 [Phytophthora capsici]|nr:hypothetical protein DVH05_005351 [Phytophthora capsici]
MARTSGQQPEITTELYNIVPTWVYKCFKCNRTPKQRLNTGYTNLYRHLDACQGKDFREKCTAALKNQNNNLGFETIEFVSERDLVVFKWLKWVIMRDMPFAEVDNELTRELAGLKSSKHISRSLFEPT